MLFTSGSNEQGDIYYNDKLFLVPAAGGPAKMLLPECRLRRRERARGARTARRIYFTANMGTHNEIMRVDVATKEAAQLTKGDHSLGGWSFAEDSGLHVFTLQHRRDRPSEIYTIRRPARAPKRVTSVFDEDLAKFKTARQEKITWKGAGRRHDRRPADLSASTTRRARSIR